MANKEANTFKGPTVMYGPNGEFEIFHDSTLVPEGWLDNPASFAKPKANDAPLPMTREEIVAALKSGNVAFKANTSTANLYNALFDALKSHCEAQNITIGDNATAPDLLKLLAA